MNLATASVVSSLAPAVLTALVTGIRGARQAIHVGADGILLATSEGLAWSEAEQWAAAASGIRMVSVGQWPDDRFELNITLYGGTQSLVTGMADGSLLALSADITADTGVIGEEMTRLADQRPSR